MGPDETPPSQPTEPAAPTEPSEAAAPAPAKTRRWAFWRRRPKAAKPPKPAKQYPWIWRARWRRWLARFVLWGAVAAAALCLIAYTAVRILLKPTDIKKLITDAVEEQTGGRIEIDQVTFNVLTGVGLHGVRFYPPLTGDTRGSRHGGEVDPLQLASFDALDVKYSLQKLLAGRVHIKALQLVKPAFHLRQTDGVMSFQSILAYRAVHFPPTAPKPEEKQAEKKESGGGILPISPSLIYMPVEILAQNVGIKDLRLDLIKIEKGQVVQGVVTSGLTFDVGVNWFGRDSDMWFSMLSPFEDPVRVFIEDTATGELRQSLNLSTALNLRVELTDLQKVNVDMAMRLLDLQTPVAGYQDLGAFAKLRLAATDDFKGLNFTTCDVDLADAMHYELGGLISVNDASFSEITLRLSQKFALDLKSAAALAHPFLPTLKADGHISFDDLKVDGTVEPDKLAAAATTGAGLPTVSGVVWLEDVLVDLPETGVSMEPIAGAVSIAAGPALSGTGSQVDLSADVTVPKLTATQKVPTVGTVQAGVEGLTSKVTARVLWPQLLAPILKVNVEAEHVRATGDHIAPLDAPLYVDLDAEGGKDLARLALSANVELTDLIEFSAMADCQNKCERFRSSMLGRMDALDRVHAIALPLGTLLGLGDFMPTKLTGGLDFQLAARGKLADPLTTPPAELIKTADVRFNVQLALAKLFAKIPFFKVNLKNFETRLLASGTMAEQKIDLSQKFDGVTLEVPQGGDKPPLAVAVDHYTFETSVANTIEGPLDLKTIMSQLATSVDTKLYIGRVAAEGSPLPKPLTEVQVGLSLEQAHMTDIKVKNINVRLPDYGTVVDVAADTVVGPDFMPKKLNTTVKASVALNGSEPLPAGIKTSGRIDVRLDASTPDMKHAALDGEASFDRFNVTIPPKDGKGPPLLAVEEIKGNVPFKQSIILPDLAALRKPGGAAAAVAQVAASASGPAGAGSKTPAAGPAVAKTSPAPSSSGVASAKGAAPTPSPPAIVIPPPPADVPEVKVSESEENKAEMSDLNTAMGKYFDKNTDKFSQSTNVVALVDYGTIRPFYPDRRPLAIKRVEAANLELTNMEFDLELRQNWFALNQFVIGFLGGKIQGDFQVSFDPNATDPRQIPKSVRVALHLTRLDTRKLIERFPQLKGKASSWDLLSNPYIDATVHIVFDVTSNDISGDIEITSIGKEQLKMMLFYVDPFEQNAQISQMRTALNFAEVRQVSIPLKNGEMGLSLDLRLFGVGVPFPTPKLQNFPVSQIIQSFRDQMAI